LWFVVNVSFAFGTLALCFLMDLGVAEVGVLHNKDCVYLPLMSPEELVV